MGMDMPTPDHAPSAALVEKQYCDVITTHRRDQNFHERKNDKGHFEKGVLFQRAKPAKFGFTKCRPPENTKKNTALAFCSFLHSSFVPNIFTRLPNSSLHSPFGNN